jgi:hypothetical protein
LLLLNWQPAQLATVQLRVSVNEESGGQAVPPF